MFRRHIRSTCSRWAHPFPVRMRYGGRRYAYGRPVHVMCCPVCGNKRYLVYHGPYYSQVG